MEGKLGEKREVVIGTAVQLEAYAVRSPTSLPPTPFSSPLKRKKSAREPDAGH